VSEEQDPRDLGEATLTGVRWVTGTRLVAEVTGFISVLVLARLVSPAEFGHAAVALVVVGVAVILGPQGLTAVLVQRPSLARSEVETVTFLCLVIGALSSSATYLFAVGGAAEAIFGSRTAGLLALASPAFFLVGLGGVPQALVQRELGFRRVGAFDAASVILGALTSVVLAAYGLNGKALVLGALVLVASAGLLALVSVPPPRPRPSREGARELAGFATPVTLSSLVYLGFRHIDYAILGAKLPAAQVGYYLRAYQLGVEYQGKLSQVMLRVSFPVFSRAGDMRELLRLRLRIVRTHATIIVPLLAGFIAVAPVLIPWLFGERWQPVVVPAQIMALAGMADAVTTGIGPLMVALGRPRLLLGWNVTELVVYVVMIALLAAHGLTWVSIGVAAFGIASMVVAQGVVMPRVIDLSLLDFWREIRAGVIGGAVALPVLVAGRIALVEAGVPTLPLLLALGVVGVAVYGAVLRLLFGEVWADLLMLVGRVLGSKRPLPDEPAGA
jgi:PST family polysaccharide transporter